ncbi:uncharacterized protein (TIGR00266 family) [Clostridium acetobutylicum]|uniref:Uncharacterized conserved protein n=1 Tax=Clostridium acetobutylicum (strain ATCC 824 / DSM 792 / JCM 1419 / IAM 19013 / LMG 5710 / NBRC 13948 / NRRL B-527 / VKM B-1787 / 2291 / W) TaxID=272562 RepID=Q97FJ9_CLOAB|nr:MULTISPECIES: TIGR00266 family protein [Clostridium]AAK80684.1 Uncharacterized conserved protein [Clostridium acetobutylicum ATCC 824]ADZ21784.1 Conserved hypothetical protein [Clostridium acetobutylicum EA 2018]AEI32524.1 hypothetical protein SMB_G2773 [Clostridium acetobutylicum DSM 1731]AWV78902.1 TIGR00266 family protein [Clostridium acetobutylicum]MBC2395140.1 TIGR00266 family protein [Clostridium acetobutylicum]
MAADYEMLYGDTNRLLKVKAQAGDKVIIEAGAMAAMNPNFEIKSKAGSVGKAIGRLFSGTSAFLQEYVAKSYGEILVAPKYLGDIKAVNMDGSVKYRLGKASFLASTDKINLNIKSGGGKGFLSGEGFIQIEAEGSGILFLSAYGAIHEITLSQGEKYIVDTNHLVLWESSMNYKVELLNGLFGSITGGEGLVCVFEGPGKMLIQSRDPSKMLAGKSS